jgi:hypothetical protein
MATVAETISGITRKHLLENNGLLFGQCVTAVGWVGGTIPPLREEDGIVELPTSDVSNGGEAVDVCDDCACDDCFGGVST